MRTATGTVNLVAATVESLEMQVYASSDPTGTVPSFALTEMGTYPTGATSWTAGAWSGSYGSDGWTTARTPTVGASASLAITAGQRRWLSVKVTVGGETAVWVVGTVFAA